MTKSCLYLIHIPGHPTARAQQHVALITGMSEAQTQMCVSFHCIIRNHNNEKSSLFMKHEQTAAPHRSLLLNASDAFEEKIN